MHYFYVVNVYLILKKTLGPRPGSVVVERSLGIREVGTTALVSAQQISNKEPTGRVGVRIMVCVGTSLPTGGMGLQWASTLKTGHRSD